MKTGGSRKMALHPLGGRCPLTKSRFLPNALPFFEFLSVDSGHLLDLDDQWELELGTSKVTLQEISRFRAAGTRAHEKKTFLEDISDMLYRNFSEKCKAESGPIASDLFQ